MKEREFPAGTLLVSSRQPLGRLAAASLEFDPHMTTEFLTEERREILRSNPSRVYDTTGWSLPMLYDVETFELTGDIAGKIYAAPAAPRRAHADHEHRYARRVRDRWHGRRLRHCRRPLDGARRVGARCRSTVSIRRPRFPRGSVVVTRKDNLSLSGDLITAVRDVCTELQLSAVGVRSGNGPGDTFDLGGRHFVLLQKPNIAIVGREPISPNGYGEVWHLVDHVLGLRAAYVNSKISAPPISAATMFSSSQRVPRPDSPIGWKI